MHLDHDLVIVHDPQPRPLIAFVRKRGPWVWRCHVELSTANAGLWAYLAPFIERYDAVVLSMPEYAQKLTTPQRFIMPAINPFSTTNKRLSERKSPSGSTITAFRRILPLVVQISRFDKWKGPQG
jgi:trehalose synthase